jgi:hypothetical protein
MHGRKLFTGIVNVKGFFALDIAPVYEIEHPFRACNHALFVHFWPGKSIVLGWWRKGRGEVRNLLLAVKGNKIDVEEEVRRFKNTGRQLLEGAEEDSEDVSDAADSSR